MFWRRRRKQTKGWALDIEDNGPYGGFRERLASSSKLWAACLILVFACVIAMYLYLRSGGVDPYVPPKHLLENPVGSCRDAPHQEFTDRLVKSWKARGVELQAKFVSDRAFRITVSHDLGQDETAFLSRFAAEGIWMRFKVNPKVRIYVADSLAPVATTTWDSNLRKFRVDFGESGKPQ